MHVDRLWSSGGARIVRPETHYLLAFLLRPKTEERIARYCRQKICDVMEKALVSLQSVISLWMITYVQRHPSKRHLCTVEHVAPVILPCPQKIPLTMFDPIVAPAPKIAG